MPARSTTDNVTNGSSKIMKEEFVISGISGKFPESSNMDEFKKNLFDGVNMANDEPRRWPKGFMGLPEHLSKLKECDFENFDQQYFGVHPKQSDCMDPGMRMLLELTHEAIVDAGINPLDLRGSRTGVYAGVSSSEVEDFVCSDANPLSESGYGLPGCQRGMFANRISYSFDFKGPSFSIDTACSSSLFAMSQALNDLRIGNCDYAIVAGCNVILRPTISKQFLLMGMMSSTGECRTFDADVNGYVRAEGVSVLFLQRASTAKRVYAQILNIRVNTDGHKPLGITYPDGPMQYQLMEETYKEINLDPKEVNYVEAHGTGTKAGDPEETNAITDFFCKNRKSPLMIGSVKSNMGHAEASSGLCSVAKTLIAMETGIIPANLHYNTPNPAIKGLMDGRLKVIDKHTPWNGGIVGINSFGFGGANAHVVLKSNPKPKAIRLNDGRPKIVLCSGRSFDAVQNMLTSAAEHCDDDEYLSLIMDVHTRPFQLHLYRGYAILNNQGALQREVIELNEEKRPIWYVYSGMGSQWPSMAKDLMQVDVFNKTIQRCADVLRKENIDLIKVLTRSTEEDFDNILNSFITITAVQIALTDLLTSLNIRPDGIIGHSAGEVACAYGDGCSTLEQTILSAYWRGKCIVDTPLPSGKMAAVGLNWKEVREKLPSDCFPVCHNSSENCTIAGPSDSMDAIVAKLHSEGVFTRMVKSGGYAFHSKYIANAAPMLRKNLEQVMPNPKERSSRWISSSVPESAWNSPAAKMASATYFTSNLISAVLFEEAMEHVPKNAITIEIAPHGLFQAILRRSLGPDSPRISLMKRNHENNYEFLLTNIGKLYAVGAQPHVQTLMRPISYPVGRGTPSLSSIVGWDHSQKWSKFNFVQKKRAGEINFHIDLSKEKFEFYAGHTIDGRILFPATGYIVLAWITYAKQLFKEFQDVPIVMEDIVFHRATFLNKKNIVKLGVNFLDGSGIFEICEGDSLVVSGKIKSIENIENEELTLEPLPANNNDKILLTNDIYKELRLRGYDYTGLFRGIINSDADATTGNLKWTGKWISFMDTMLQFGILSKNLRELYLPTRIQRIVINPTKHLQKVSELSNEAQIKVGLPIYSYKSINVTKSGGVEIHGLNASQTQKRPSGQNAPTLERYTFIPNFDTKDVKENLEKVKLQALEVAVQILLENSSGALKLKGVELENGRSADILMATSLQQMIEKEPVLLADIAVVSSNNNKEAIATVLGNSGVRIITKDIMKEPVENNCHFIYGVDILARPDSATLKNSIATIKDNGFLFLDENITFFKNSGRQILTNNGLIIVSEQCCGTTRVMVTAKRIVDIAQRQSSVVYVTEKNFDWVEEVKKALALADQKEQYVYIVCQGEELFGAIGLMNCIKNENGGKYARLVFIQDKKAEKFSLTSSFYKIQLEKDLISNVLKNGVWGTYRHLNLASEMATLQVNQAYVNTLTKGDLSSFKWIEAPRNPSSSKNTLEQCTVYYAPINFRDVMLASGKLGVDALPGDIAEQDCVMGLEFAGRDSTGRRIMAMVTAKSLATTCLASKRMMWKVPPTWTMEEASTVPCVYSTVYYALHTRGQMKKGEKILIHAGSGGVGQAAISVALHHGLTVFTTVGSKDKREFLKKRFPKLQERNIGNSRDTSFEQMILRETNGKGVDLVLNSLSEEKLLASVRCLGINGRFLEIGKFDLSSNNPLGMSVFLKNTSFHGILLDSVMEGDEAMQAEIVSLVADGIKNGAVIPLPTSIFNEDQIESAFRFMASGKHIGKVVVKIRDEEDGNRTLMPKPRMINALPRTYMHPEKSYIIVGGLGGFGLELTNWLVIRGARIVVLTSRSGVKTGYQSMMIRRWQQRGVKVVIDTNDVATAKGCENLLESSSKLGIVGGIFNLAAVLKDALIEQLTAADFKTVADPKITATKFLDQYSRTLCTGLEYFVCFSSVSCGRGNIGQTNYGLANSAMERICEQRQSNGFPGCAIQWGAIGDTGLVIETMGATNDTIIGGTLPQRMSSCLQTFDTFLQQPHPVMASMVVAGKRKTTQTDSISVVESVGNIIGLRDLKNIQNGTTLLDLGMDSLMGTEIKQTLERNFDIVLSVQDIRQMTFGKLRTLDSGGGEKKSEKVDSPTEVLDKTMIAFQKELLPKEALIRMETKAPLDSKKRPIFFISAIEGFVASIEELTKNLDYPAYGLQWTEEVPLENIELAAEFFYKQIYKVQPKGPYTVAGYSFGALPAYVLANQMEKNDEKVKLIMLDGAPNFVKVHTEKAKGKLLDQNAAEARALAFFSSLTADMDIGFMYQTLSNFKSFEVKLEKIAEILTHKINQPTNLIIRAANVFCRKLILSDVHHVAVNLEKSDVILLKPIITTVNLSDDYGLEEICKQSLKIYNVPGNHRTFLEQKESAEAISNFLRS